MTLLMPALFVGHGSPMNALENNKFSQLWKTLGKEITKPRAILVISAHWYVTKTSITGNMQNKTIHDFYGFPHELATFEYLSIGSSELAKSIQEQLAPEVPAYIDYWGLDHGAWSILTHMYPNPNMPILQLSIDSSKPPEYHFFIGQKLRKLREDGILIIASGNIVHNLSVLSWQQKNYGYDWAIKFDEQVIKLINERKFDLLNNYISLSSALMAVPTPEHFLPLLYILGMINDTDEITIFNQDYQYGSLSMTSVKVG